MQLLTPQQIQAVNQLCASASEQVLEAYRADFTVFSKTDNSPVTTADLAASAILEGGLPRILDCPVLSEENVPTQNAWLAWETYWLIDPIDGTKHFINKTGEFCICVALIHRHRAVFGLIYQPITQMAWFACYNSAAVSKTIAGQPVELPNEKPELPVVVISSGMGKKMQALIDSIPACRWYNRGSALKYIDIIEGKATLYPKMWDTCEWDSAAGQCLLECAGGRVVRFDNGESLLYGKSASLINPHFIADIKLSDELLKQLRATYRQIHSLPPLSFDSDG